MSSLDDAVREGRVKYMSLPLFPPYTRNCECPRHAMMGLFGIPQLAIPAKWIFFIYERNDNYGMRIHEYLAECDQCHELRERLAA